MPKRFTATEKWDDPWYRKLPIAWKAAWQYLTDRCDTTGVIDLDEELANFHIGDEVDWTGFIDHATAKRIMRLANGKLYLPSFVKFQYGELKAECHPHRAILKQLEKHGLLRVPEGYREGTCTPQDKDKDKEKVLEGAEPKPKSKQFTKPTLDEVTAYCRERGGKVNPQTWLDHYESNGWRVGRNPMKDWRAAVRKWENSEYGSKAQPPPVKGDRALLIEPEEFKRLKDYKNFLTGPYRKKLPDGRVHWSGQKRDGTRVECYLEPQEATA